MEVDYSAVSRRVGLAVRRNRREDRQLDKILKALTLRTGNRHGWPVVCCIDMHVIMLYGGTSPFVWIPSLIVV